LDECAFDGVVVPIAFIYVCALWPVKAHALRELFLDCVFWLFVSVDEE
jgi:hypothetical protein